MSNLVKSPQTLTKYKLVKNMDLVLADLSGSMADAISDTMSKYDCLKQALAVHNDRIGIIGFGLNEEYEQVFETSAHELPPPLGGTPLTQALDKAFGYEPMHILVISDGQPNNKATALESAKRLSDDAVIDVLYIGPKRDRYATDFMRELAEVGRGRYVEYDLVAEGAANPLMLANKVRALLALPAPKTIEL